MKKSKSIVYNRRKEILQYLKTNKDIKNEELANLLNISPLTIRRDLQALENEGLVYTERTNGKFVTDNKELIEKIKKELAEKKVNNFLNDMKNIGITYEEAVIYLQELGGKK